MHRVFYILVFFFLLSTMLSAQQSGAKSEKKDQPYAPSFSARLPSEEAVNSFLQQTFGYDPGMSWKVLEIRPAEAEGLAEVLIQVSSAQGKQGSKLYVTADGRHAIAGDLIPFGAKPFEEAREKLAKGIFGPSTGAADAPVSIVEFSDLQCPFCKQAQPTIDKLLSEEKNARLTFQNFPLPMHNWSAKGAHYADCVARKSPEAFWTFVHTTFDQQSDITPENADEKLTANVEKAGLKGKEIATCAASAETAGRVQRSIQLGTEVEVTGTPTLYINGRRISNVTGVPYEVLKQLVEFAARPPAPAAQ
jgi:protein-disulfide isomerase